MNNRPGYKYGKNRDGTIRHYWIAKQATTNAPAKYPNQRLPDNATDEEINRLCQDYTTQLLAEMDERKRPTHYTGKLDSLITLYRTDPFSPFADIKASTRVRDYEPALRMIEKSVGDRYIPSLTGSDLIAGSKSGRKRSPTEPHTAR